MKISHFARSILLGSMAALLFDGCKARTNSNSEEKFYSNQAAQVQVSFDGRLIVTVPEKHRDNMDDLLTSDYRAEIDHQIQTQLDYMTGTLLNNGVFATHPAVVVGRPKLIVKKVEAIKADSSKAIIHYSYTDVGVFSKALITSPSLTMELVLPAMVTDFYKRALLADGSNPCINGKISEEEKFWYYWKADAKGCQLKSSDLVKLAAAIKTLPQTTNTLPWYDDLFGTSRPASASRSRHTLKATLLLGEAKLDEHFKNTLEGLKTIGFKEVQSTEDVSQSSLSVAPMADKPKASVLRLTRTHFDVELEVWVLAGGSDEFKRRAAEGLTKSDIFIYAGHSSYGKFLDPAVLGITAQSFDQSKAQVFYFSGCRTFNYYNSKFFDLKANKLNIVTTSVPSYRFTYPKTIPAFLDGITDEKRLLWKDIIDQMQQGEIDALSKTTQPGVLPFITWPKFKALLSVNGDENNPRR